MGGHLEHAGNGGGVSKGVEPCTAAGCVYDVAPIIGSWSVRSEAQPGTRNISREATRKMFEIWSRTQYSLLKVSIPCNWTPASVFSEQVNASASGYAWVVAGAKHFDFHS